MFNLSVVIGPGGTQWRFLFKAEETVSPVVLKLDEALRNQSIALHTATDLVVEFYDDFGQASKFRGRDLHGYMIEDLDKQKLGAIEVHMHNAQTQIMVEQRMRSDPTITAHARSRQSGPPILAPMGNGFTR